MTVKWFNWVLKIYSLYQVLNFSLFFEGNELLVKNIQRRNITTPVYIECDIMYQ